MATEKKADISTPPLISLMVPVYNGEKTLPACLFSVLSQTFTDFECILVNDGSTDDTAGILRQHQEKDPRFRLITVENGGVSKARNLALAQAKGSFWAFLDCDDILEPDALETLYRQMEDPDLDMAVGAILGDELRDGSLHKGTALQGLPPPQRFSAAEAAEAVFQGYPYAGHLHGKLFRAARMGSLRFRKDVFIYEDMLFVLEALRRARKVSFTPHFVYRYHATEAGAMAAAMTERKASSLIACGHMIALAQADFPAAIPQAKRFAFSNALWVLEELAASPAETRTRPWAKQVQEGARDMILGQKTPKNLPLVQKVFCAALRLGWPVFYALYEGPYRMAKGFQRKHP